MITSSFKLLLSTWGSTDITLSLLPPREIFWWIVGCVKLFDDTSGVKIRLDTGEGSKIEWGEFWVVVDWSCVSVEIWD